MNLPDTTMQPPPARYPVFPALHSEASDSDPATSGTDAQGNPKVDREVTVPDPSPSESTAPLVPHDTSKEFFFPKSN